MSSYESLPLQVLENDLVEENVEYLERDEDLSYGCGYDFIHELEDDFFEDTNCSEDHLEPVEYPYSLPGYDVEYPEPNEVLLYCSGYDFNHELEDDFVEDTNSCEDHYGLFRYDVEYPEPDEDLFYTSGYDVNHELEYDFVEDTNSCEDHLEPVENLYCLLGYDGEYPEPDENLFYCSGYDFNHGLEDDFVEDTNSCEDHLEPVEYLYCFPSYDVEYPEPDEDLFYGSGYDLNCELEDDFVDHPVEYPYGLPGSDRNLSIDPNINFEAHMKVFHDMSMRDRRPMESIKSIVINVEGVERAIITNTESIIGASVRNSHRIDNGGDTNNIRDPEAQRKRNTAGCCSGKIDLEKIATITNIVLEILSAVCDQVSSTHKPRYALVSMLLSFAALLICSTELVYKVRKERVTWKWRSRLPWLYHPSQTPKPFGNFKDLIGLVCAICQCIVTTISFGFLPQKGNNPIKICVLPIIYAIGLLWSKFMEKPQKRTTVS
ncbi:putative Serine/threonine-protein kinase PBS1 [Melia azedarach]|uniref:Serine/threonine-protein kinase PBS1 n=1 Tax=Melia azedarach TaxID=155640 RepID=A0ACC1Y1G6_MELAZ|nr:putative Serine/threonine-protein kinase PBS1 [Melia azedarach]